MKDVHFLKNGKITVPYPPNHPGRQGGNYVGDELNRGSRSYLRSYGMQATDQHLGLTIGQIDLQSLVEM